MEHQIVHIVVIVACAGVFAQWIAWRFRFPAIVVLTLLGIILGPVTNIVDPAGGLWRHAPTVCAVVSRGYPV